MIVHFDIQLATNPLTIETRLLILFLLLYDAIHTLITRYNNSITLRSFSLAANSSQQLTIASTVIRDGSGLRLPSSKNECVTSYKYESI